MAVVEVMSVRRTVLPTSPRTQRTKPVAMTITPENGGATLNIPYAPREVNHTNLIAEYVTVPRPGLLENVIYSGLQRPRMTFDLEIHDKKITSNVGRIVTNLRALAVIQTLQNMARTGKRVRIAYGTLESGLWFIIGMSVKSSRRDPLTDEITGAEVSIEAIRGDATIAGTGTGPVTGGAVTTSKPIPAPITGGMLRTAVVTQTTTTPAARYHRVKAGDTLSGLSLRYYGTTVAWRTIGDANRIKDPRKLPVGINLRIP